MSAALVHRVVRRGCALGLYRTLLNLALLVIAFRDFPDHKVVVALAVLVFSQAVNATLTGQSLFFVQQNRLDDLAERKTRHAIQLASEEGRSQYHFWSEIDRRVAEEAEADESSPWWTQVGLVLWSFGGYLIGDLITIAIAAAIAG